MRKYDAPKSDSLKDRLLFESNRVAQSALDIERSDREYQYNLVQELLSKKLSEEELDELKPLCYQRLQLLISIDRDNRALYTSPDPEIKHLEGILDHRQLIRDNTRAINFSFRTGRAAKENLNSEHVEKLKQVSENVEELFRTVNPQSITDFRWEMGHRAAKGDYVNIYDPNQFFAIPAKNLLQIVSTFNNLVIFQYISLDSGLNFEEIVSKTVASLPNLEVLVIAREESQKERWFEYYTPDMAYEESVSKLMSKTLSSLTKLKRLHLQGLITPRSGWGKLDWKCPVEYLKVTECPRLRGEAIVNLAYAFRKTLLGLLIGPDVGLIRPTDQPKIEFGSGQEFAVLEELSVRLQLEDEEQLMDYMSQAPNLKHFDIHHCLEDIIFCIKEQLEQPGAAWPSLQTLGVDFDDENDTDLSFDLLDEEMKDVTEFISHKFGVLDAEWDWHSRYDHRVNYDYGKMTLSSGRVIEVKALKQMDDDRTSLQYLDTVKLISQLSP